MMLCCEPGGLMQQYKFTFRRHIDIEGVADALTLSILRAENLHGRSKVRMDGWWRFDRQRRSCVIDAATEVGKSIARLFTGYLSKEFGERSFHVLPVKQQSRKK